MANCCNWNLVIPPTNEIRAGILESADGRSGGWSVGEMLCLKFLSQFTSQLPVIETFCT